MGINFPESPTASQKFDSGSKKYRFSTPVWNSDDYSALQLNHIVNPNFTISQQNGTGNPPTSLGSSWYTADQWVAGWQFMAAGLTAHSYAVDVSEPPVWPGNAAVHYNATAQGLAHANDYCHHYQYLEGQRMADFLWGTASARPAVLRFACMSPSPGSYSAGIQNYNQTRSFYSRFTITVPQVWQEFVIPIPGDTAGTWPTDNTAWGFVHINGAMSTAYVGGTANVWNAGGYYTDGVFNFAANVGHFRVAMVGLYLDPFSTGVAPYWVEPQYAEQQKLCMRYWYRCYGIRGIWNSAAQGLRWGIKHPVKMRTNPSSSIVGSMPIWDGGAGGALANLGTDHSNMDYYEVDPNATAASFTFPRGGGTYNNGPDNYIAVSARF